MRDSFSVIHLYKHMLSRTIALICTWVVLGMLPVAGQDDTAKASYLSGLEYYDKGQYDFALFDFDKAIETGNMLEAYYWRGKSYFKLGNLQKALADFDTLLARNPHFIEAYVYRGRIRLKLQQYEQALQDFNRAYKQDSNNVEILRERVIIFHELGRTADAIEDLKRLIDITPNYYEYHANLAGLYLRNEDYKAAVTAYTRAIDLMQQAGAKDDPDLYYNRGVARLELNQTEQACRDLTIAENLGHIYAPDVRADRCGQTAEGQ